MGWASRGPFTQRYLSSTASANSEKNPRDGTSYIPSVYSTCLHCTRDLGANDVLETMPIGRRVAFDAGQGRLWVVCQSCGRWNLVPFDTRLETIDACERLFRETRTRYSTDQIGLARLREGLDLVRIGAPQRPEFASWRYGAQYKRRRRRNLALGGAGLVATVAVNNGLSSLLMPSSPSLMVGVPISMALLYGVVGAGYYLRGLWRRVLTTVPGTPGVVRISAETAGTAHLALVDGEMALSWSPGFVAALRKRHLSVSGPDARLLVRKVLGLVNRTVGSAKELDHAVGRIEAGGVDQWLSRLTTETVGLRHAPFDQRMRLGLSQANPWIRPPGQPLRYDGFEAQGFVLASLGRSDRLALEMWLSEEDEARALGGELALLERQWQEAEQLAKIADSLALPEEVSRTVD